MFPPRYALLPLASLLLGGCLDLQQQIWINPDGTGRLRIDAGIDMAWWNQLPDEDPGQAGDDLGEGFRRSGRMLRLDQRIRSLHVEEYEDQGYARAALEITAHHWRDLPGLARSVLETIEVPVAGWFHLLLFRLEEREDGMTLYSQPLADARPVERSPEQEEPSPFRRLLQRAVMDQGSFTVTLTSPTISRANGTWLSDRTGVRWSLPLSQALEELPAGTFSAEIGPSARSGHFWRVVGIILTVSLLVALLAWFRHQRRNHPPPTAPVAPTTS